MGCVSSTPSPQTHVLSNYLPIGYLACGESHDTVVDLTLDLLHTLQHSSSTRVQTVLLYGPRGRVIPALPLTRVYNNINTRV